jgi:nucleoside-diphosphate-sugar epimerase
MKIWIPRQDHPAIAAAAIQLALNHEVTTSDALSDLCDPGHVKPMLSGIDLMICDALPPSTIESEEDIIDQSARAAYVALEAAVAAGTTRAVLVSNLSCFENYPSEFVIDESWRPRPFPEASSLAPLMAERTFREFARQGPIESICLRFGALDVEGGTPISLAVEAIVRSCKMPIEQDSYRWWLFHIADSPRFPLRATTSAPMQLGGGG